MQSLFHYEMSSMRPAINHPRDTGSKEAPQKKVPQLARLLDGRGDCSETYRLQCEARSVLKLPFRERRIHLNEIERIRGKPARETLEAEIWRQFKQSQ